MVCVVCVGQIGTSGHVSNQITLLNSMYRAFIHRTHALYAARMTQFMDILKEGSQRNAGAEHGE